MYDPKNNVFSILDGKPSQGDSPSDKGGLARIVDKLLHEHQVADSIFEKLKSGQPLNAEETALWREMGCPK